MGNNEVKGNTQTYIDINDFKNELRSMIEEKYGSLAKFLRSDDAQNLGLDYGDRVYLYENAAISIEKLNCISKWLGGKVIKKKTEIVKVVKYFVED